MKKTMRVQRFIAQAALASRREAEKLIEAGRVRVNGKVVREMGVTVDPDRDEVRVDNQPVSLEEEKIYVLLHKPPLSMTTRTDPRGRPTVYKFLKNLPPHLAYVGRLDWDAEGALLFTNDGDFVHAMTHPRYHVPKTYLVKVNGVPDNKALEALRRGVRLDDGRRTKPCEVDVVEITHGENAWIKITLWEGRQNQIKRMMTAIRYRTNRIYRTHIGDIHVGNLPQGEWRFLTEKEVHRLMEMVSDGEVALPKIKRQVSIPKALPEKSRAPRGRSPKAKRGPKDPGRGRGQKPEPRFYPDAEDGDEIALPVRRGRGAPARGGKTDRRGKPVGRGADNSADEKPQRGERRGRDDARGKPGRKSSGEKTKRQDRRGMDDPPRGKAGRKSADEKPKRSDRGEKPAKSGKPTRKSGEKKSSRSGSSRAGSTGRKPGKASGAKGGGAAKKPRKR